MRRQSRLTADGCEEIIYRVVCPVCGQLGPAIPALDEAEERLIAKAIEAWNAMMARVSPFES